MKKFTFILVGFLFFFGFKSIAQKPTEDHNHKHKNGEKCGSMMVYERYIKENQELIQRTLQNRLPNQQPQAVNNGTYRTNSIVTIPIVVHIVMQNPNQISNADVQSVLDKWNVDFSGLNADSTNGANFYNVRGHSNLRFCLAKRTPSGALTSGIQRRASNIAFTTGANDPIKSFAAGGLDSWDNTQYMNVWVGVNNGGILGYATFPGTATAATDGLVINSEAFSLNPCYTIPQYNLGRTTLHEIGHYLGLWHLWGDETGCVGDDFRQLGGTVQFPTGLFNPAGQGNTPTDVGDTPNQAGSTTNCPTGVATDACSPSAPGKMYQNYMDYTSDLCYSMFTNKQVARMEWIIDNPRAGLKTSLGCTPPAGATLLDVEANSSVSPGGSEYIGCNLINYPANFASCAGNASMTPKVRIQNNGVTTLNTATVSYTINGGAPVTINATALNLITGYSAVVTFPTLSLPTGVYNFVFTVSSPNGGVDQVTTNNSISSTFTVSALTPVASPLFEGFENATFPSAGWTLNQVSGVGNWARVTTTSATGTASARFDNYNFAAGVTSSLTSPNVTFSPTFNNATLTFNYAHQSYTAAPNNEPDELDVQISTNCGATWTSLWRRVGSQLITAVPANATAAFSGNPRSQWTANPINISLTPYLAQTVQIRFVARSGFGNNLYLDDINIAGSTLPPNDASISAINTPLSAFCGSGFTPQVVVRNNGTATLTQVTVFSGVGVGTANPTANVNQLFTGLNVAPGATTTLTLNPVTGLVNGSFNFRAYTNLPNGVNDQNATNDTLRKPFVANVATTNFPIIQTFESTWTGTATAPIPGNSWTVLNPNSNGTWTRSTAGARSGVASGMMDNYNLNAPGQLDYFVAPLVNFAGRDSAYVTFDYAYKLYAAADTDTLELVVSTNCGTTWTSVWKKGGQELATTTGTGGAAFTPTSASMWVSENVNLEAYRNSGDVYIALRNRNDFGQRLFIDNINIVGKNIPNNDAHLTSIDVPGIQVCEASPTISVTFRNAGKLAINNVSAGYSIDGGANTTQAFTLTPPVAPGTSRTLTFTTRPTLALGTRVIRAYTFSPNSVQDENVANDSITKSFNVIQPLPAPLTEGFNGTTFPPANWSFNEAPINATKWVRTSKAPNTRLTLGDSGVAFMQNFNTTAVAANSLDYLSTPFLNVTKSDSVFFKFDVSAASRQYPGSTLTPLDTLEVQASIDCGNNWISVYKKWGENLQTINDPNSTFTFSFVPNDVKQWRTDSINLTPWIANGGNIRLRFLNTSNNGNNVYLDNVNLYTKNLSAALKTNGLIVAPNPVQNTVVIQHYLPPTNLRGIGFYNAAGQRLMYQSYNGNADSYLPFNISRFAAGVYSVRIEYTNRTITQRIIKL